MDVYKPLYRKLGRAQKLSKADGKSQLWEVVEKGMVSATMELHQIVNKLLSKADSVERRLEAIEK
jgi:hypothetical protein